MSTTIRVYPQGTTPPNPAQGTVSAQTYYNEKLKSQQQISTLQLGYERALGNERLEIARFEERLKNPYLNMNGAASPYGAAYGTPYAGAMDAALAGYLLPAQAAMPVTTNPVAATPQAGTPIGSGGGQSNITNQVSLGAGTQSVTNSNTFGMSDIQTPWASTPYGGYGSFGSYGSYGGTGGFLSGLLGSFF